MKHAPYGSWKSKITPEMVATSGVAFQEIRLDGDDLYWLAMLPDSAATYQIFKKSQDGKTALLPTGFSARSLVYDYGGGSFTVVDGDVFFVNYDPSTDDQIVYRLTPGQKPQPLTKPMKARYGDLTYHKLIKFFVGQVMKASRGKANPRLAEDLLLTLLAKRK